MHNRLTSSKSAWVCSDLPRETPWIIGNYLSFPDWIAIALSYAPLLYMPIESFFNIFDLIVELLSALQRAAFSPFFHQSKGYAIASSFHNLDFPVKMFILYPQRKIVKLSTTSFCSFL